MEISEEEKKARETSNFEHSAIFKYKYKMVFILVCKKHIFKVSRAYNWQFLEQTRVRTIFISGPVRLINFLFCIL